MADKRKSIIDQALLESEQIEKAFEANAKEILAHTMSSEIEEMVKESLEDSMDDEDGEDDMDLDLDLDLGDEDVDASSAGDDMDLDLGDMDDMGDMDMGDMDMDDMGDMDVVDLTDADDSEVIRVFKKMGPEDEIEVVQDGTSVDIKDTETGAEYRVELGGAMEGGEDDMDLDLDGEESLELDLDDLTGGLDMDGDMEGMDDMDVNLDADEMDIDIDMDDDDDELEESVIYEIELDEEDDEDVDYTKDDEDTVEENMRTLGNGRKWGRKGLDKPQAAPRHVKESREPRNSKLINENKVIKNKLSKAQGDNEQLKEDYNKMVGALKEFRTKLNEVAVFNSNLTYSVRLFTENTTTKEEKIDIIKRFDDVKSLKESKSVYKHLVKEISKVAPIKESIDEKLNTTKTSGSSTKINESKVYVNPELAKMKKLWSYEYKN